MTEKEIMMARQASRLYRNLQAENQRLREQLSGDPVQDAEDREVFQMVRRNRENETQSQVYQMKVRPVFDYETAEVMDAGSFVFADEELMDEDVPGVRDRARVAVEKVRFAVAVVIATGIWTARTFDWVDTTTAIAMTVTLGLMASFFGII